LEYEKAIAQATEYIEKLNSQIKELQAFAAEVEEIADKANAQKTVAKRKTELESIVGLDLLDISDKDIEAMNEASYAILKKSMAKTASAIDKAAEDLEKAKAASVAISHKPRQTSAPMVVSSEVIETKKNSAEALIGFAFSKKR
jgi:cell division septum initiation protein DivIVA